MNHSDMPALLQELGVSIVGTSPFGGTPTLRWGDARGEVIEGLFLASGGLRLNDDCRLEPDTSLWDSRPWPSEDVESVDRWITPKSGVARAAVRQLLGLSDETECRPRIPKFILVRENREYVFLEKLADAAAAGYKVVNYRSHTKSLGERGDFTTWEALLEWQGVPQN